MIIDDTPQAVVLSSFDGIRREVAKLTLSKLIEDGRIHPARIEEMYYQSKAEIEDTIRQAGEQAVFEANCGEVHEELVKILGRLRFRTSYGQNVLKHTLEVVHLAGIMAAELQASVKTARRAALLHDLGKALTHEVEGSHALLSAQYARRYGESPAVVHAIEAHHYEVEPQTVEAVLLIAADAISASRPGARGESLEHYIKRLEALEERRRPPRGRREGLRAPGRPRDPRDRQAEGDRRRRGGAALTRDRPRDRGSARVPRPDQGDRDPRVAGYRVREVMPRERSTVRALPGLEVGAKYWSSSRCASRASVAAWVEVNASARRAVHLVDVAVEVLVRRLARRVLRLRLRRAAVRVGLGARPAGRRGGRPAATLVE